MARSDNSMDRILEVKLVGWFQGMAWIAVMVIGFILNRSELQSGLAYMRQAVDQQRQQIEELKEQLNLSQEQRKRWCLQYESDMDKYIRNHPEFNRHPWICDAN